MRNTVLIIEVYSRTNACQVLIVMHHLLQEYSTKGGGSTFSIILQSAHVHRLCCYNPKPLVCCI